MNVYQENGYSGRKEYLVCLAEEMDVPVPTVMMLASILGPSEDFDGLVTLVEDYAERE